MFDFIGGGELARVTITVTTLSTMVPSSELSKTFNIFSAFYLLANMAGAASAAFWMSSSVYVLNTASALCFLVTIGPAILITPSLGQKIETTESLDPLLDELDAESVSSTPSETPLASSAPNSSFLAPRELLLKHDVCF